MGNCFSGPSDAEPVAAEPVKPVANGTVKVEPSTAKAVNGEVAKSKEEAPVATTKTAGSKPVRVAIIYYSTYGHIAALARKILAGANSVPGVTAELYQVPETLPEEVLAKKGAPPKDSSVPVITPDLLPDFDGFIFGFPTCFGTMAAQFKVFLDSTGGLWAKGGLVGKPASIFTATGTQGGGLEETVFTSLPVLAHHGMIFVPTGYSFGERLFSNEAVRGGTAYGSSTFAGADGSRQPSELELDYAEHQGQYVSNVIKKLAAN